VKSPQLVRVAGKPYPHAMLKQALTGKILGSFQGEAATLTVSVLPNDTCAAWLKRPNEEANPQESLCE
jgi:hypothetical protein